MSLIKVLLVLLLSLQLAKGEELMVCNGFVELETPDIDPNDIIEVHLV